MRREHVLIIFFIAGVFLSTIGAIAKILHFNESHFLLMFGLYSTGVFIIMALCEILLSQRIDRNEKLMWIIGFFFMNIFAGILYFLYGRKRIVALQKDRV